MSEAVENPTSQQVHDPVCHMDLAANDAAGSMEYDGFTYYFCSQHCLDAFERDPQGVIDAENDHDHGSIA